VGRAAAFFDMDLTLLAVNSGTLWLRHLVRTGEISLGQIVRGVGWLLQYRLALIDGEVVTRQVAATVRGQREADMVARCDRWFASEVARYVTPAAHAAVEEHRREGHLLAILSSSSPYATGPLARRLDIPHVLCSRLRVADGRFTGEVEPPVCYGAGKVARAEVFALEHDVDLAASWFYTDSYADLPMLERVGHPVVVNPDVRLGRHARRVGWPVRTWRL
jgi:HAD superfamily hydrolase (TIGR01490 family)